MDFKSKEFKDLQNVWYKKLAASGFNDLEDEKEFLKKHSLSALIQHTSGRLEYVAVKQEYYRLASHFLHDYHFPDAITKYIWKSHSEGLSMREISIRLKKDFNVSKGKTLIHTTIKKLVGEMKQLYKGVT